MKLFYTKKGSGPALIILHGVFGSGDNWNTLAKRFSEKYTVYLPDARNHGHSPRADSMSYAEMAEDLFELIQDENLDKVNLLGHSMGGKTVMTFAQKHAVRIRKLIVADIGVKAYPPHHDFIFKALSEVDPSKYRSRSEVEDVMKQYLTDPSVCQFILKSLYWKEDKTLGWRLNVPVIKRDMEKLMAALPPAEVEVPTLFLRGEKSNYITEADYSTLKERFPNSEIITLPTGHWVHAEAPDQVYNAVMKFLGN